LVEGTCAVVVDHSWLERLLVDVDLYYI